MADRDALWARARASACLAISATTDEAPQPASTTDADACLRCGKALSAAARFCGTCGQPRRERPHSVSAAKGLGIAAASYGIVMLSNVLDLGAAMHGWDGFGFTDAVTIVACLVASLALGRVALTWLALPRWTLRGFTLTALALGAALAAAGLLGMIVELSDALYLFEFRLDGGLGRALLVVACFVPFLEEWLFRGVILEALLPVFSKHAAVIVTALLFAILHLTPSTIVHHALAGYVCGRVRLESGSLWSAIACHGAYNAIVVWQAW